MVSSTPHWYRRAFRFSVVTFCTAGCLYQVWAFLSHYFSYPSVVDIDISYPDSVPTPAFTVCNNNGLRRRAICEADVENELCIMSPRGQEICEQNPDLCKNRTFMSYYMVPNPDLLDQEIAESTEDLDKFGHKAESLFKECFVSWAPDFNPCRRDLLVRSITSDPFEIGRNCYTLNSLIDLPQTPASSFPLESKGTFNYISFIVDLEPEEYFQTKRSAEGFLHLHSPYIMENPFAYALIILPGQVYNFQINVKSSTLLPAPFQTNCTDYLAHWKSKGITGPLTKQNCIDQCITQAVRAACNCTPFFIPLNFDKLSRPLMNCLREADKEACVNVLDISHCDGSCPKECIYLTYDHILFQRIYESPPTDDHYFDPEFGVHNLGIDLDDEAMLNLPFKELPSSYRTMFQKERYVKVTIQLKRAELISYTQKPKYESIELFSFIGSYLGMWLGLSLVTITDFAENFVEFTLIPWYYALTRKKTY